MELLRERRPIQMLLNIQSASPHLLCPSMGGVRSVLSPSAQFPCTNDFLAQTAASITRRFVDAHVLCENGSSPSKWSTTIGEVTTVVNLRGWLTTLSTRSESASLFMEKFRRETMKLG